MPSQRLTMTNSLSSVQHLTTLLNLRAWALSSGPSKPASQVQTARHGSLLVKHLMCTWHCISSLKHTILLLVEDFFFLTSQNSLPSPRPTHTNLPLSTITTKKREEGTLRKIMKCVLLTGTTTRSDCWNTPFFPSLHPTRSLQLTAFVQIRHT